VAAGQARLAAGRRAALVTSAELRYRRAEPEDGRAMHDIFLESIAEVDRRVGSADAVAASDPAVREASWAEWRSLFDHIATTADEAWVAEDDAGELVGYARSISRDGVRELTEFFVRPAVQGQGVGRELLQRAFSADGARHRSIVATLELGALGRYLKTGLSARCLVLYVSATPREHHVATDLEPIRLDTTAAALGALDRIDRQVIGYTRRVDHEWILAGAREGFLFRRGGDAVAYGFVGERSGPVAVLDPADTPAVLAFLESRAAARQVRDVGFWLPSVNREATAYLLGRGFRIDPFIATFFGDDPGVALDRYLITSPPFFL
jgi:GNAT superfamily N-acetyltransferase